MLNADNNSKALKSGFWYIFSNMLVRGVAFLTNPIFARLLTKEQLGEYSSYYSWMTIAFIVVTMRLESSFISAKFDYKDRLSLYTRSIIALTALLTLGWTILTNVFSSFFTAHLGVGRFYINLLLVYSFFQSVISIFQINERFHYRYKQAVFISVITTVGTAGLSIALALLLNDRLAGRILGGILPVVPIGLVLLLLFFRSGVRIDPSIWPYAVKICVPVVPHLLSLQLLNSMDRIMIEKICGAADGALYFIAYSVGHMVTLLMTALNSAFSPWLGDMLHKGDTATIRRVSRYYTGVFAVLVIGIMLLAPELLLIMGGRGYLDARYVMPPVAMGCVCQSLYTLYVNVEQYKKKTASMAAASVSAAALNYGLNAYFIPRYGYIAAAYTTLAGYLFLLVAHMLLVKKLRLGEVYDDKFVVGLVAVMLLLTIGISYMFAYPIVRVACVGLYALLIFVGVWLKRGQIKKLFYIVTKRRR